MCERDCAARPHCASCVAPHLHTRAWSQASLIHVLILVLALSRSAGERGGGKEKRAGKGAAARTQDLLPYSQPWPLSCFLLLDLGFLALHVRAAVPSERVRWSGV